MRGALLRRFPPGIYAAGGALDPAETAAWMKEADVRFGPVPVRPVEPARLRPE